MRTKKSGIYHTSDLPDKKVEAPETEKDGVIGVMVKDKGMGKNGNPVVSGEEYAEKREKEFQERMKKIKLDPDRKNRIKRMELGDLPRVRKK